MVLDAKYIALKDEIIKAERRDEVIIMYIVIHHDAEWVKIRFGLQIILCH